MFWTIHCFIHMKITVANSAVPLCFLSLVRFIIKGVSHHFFPGYLAVPLISAHWLIHLLSFSFPKDIFLKIKNNSQTSVFLSVLLSLTAEVFAAALSPEMIFILPITVASVNIILTVRLHTFLVSELLWARIRPSWSVRAQWCGRTAWEERSRISLFSFPFCGQKELTELLRSISTKRSKTVEDVLWCVTQVFRRDAEWIKMKK